MLFLELIRFVFVVIIEMFSAIFSYIDKTIWTPSGVHEDGVKIILKIVVIAIAGIFVMSLL